MKTGSTTISSLLLPDRSRRIRFVTSITGLFSPHLLKVLFGKKEEKKKASLAHVWGRFLHFPAPCQRMKKNKKGGKDLLAKDPFEGPAGDPPAFRGTLVLRDGEELARRFWEFGFLDRHGLHGWTCIENQEEMMGD